MKKIYLSIIIAAIYALAFVAVFGIFGCPDETLSLGNWFALFVASKAIGFAAVFGIALLIGGSECVKAFFKGIVTNDVEPKHANN